MCRQEVYRQARDVFGAQAQLVVALEELSEAQKEICKFLRGKGDPEHLAEEIADALEAIRKWCGDCGSAIEAVLSVPAARGWEPDGVTNLLRDVVRGAKPGTPFVQEYAIDLQDQQLDTDVACDFVAAEMGVYVKTVLEENHQLFSVRRDERIPDLAYISCAVSLQPGGRRMRLK